MYNADLLNETLAKAQTYTAPVVKANKLFVASLEKLLGFQFGLLRSYADFGLGRLQAATDVTDVESLKTFAAAQLEAAGALRQKALDDAQAYADLLAGFKAEFEKLVADNGVELAPKPVVKAARKAAAVVSAA